MVPYKRRKMDGQYAEDVDERREEKKRKENEHIEHWAKSERVSEGRKKNTSTGQKLRNDDGNDQNEWRKIHRPPTEEDTTNQRHLIWLHCQEKFICFVHLSVSIYSFGKTVGRSVGSGAQCGILIEPKNDWTIYTRTKHTCTHIAHVTHKKTTRNY